MAANVHKNSYQYITNKKLLSRIHNTQKTWILNNCQWEWDKLESYIHFYQYKYSINSLNLVTILPPFARFYFKSVKKCLIAILPPFVIFHLIISEKNFCSLRSQFCRPSGTAPEAFASLASYFQRHRSQTNRRIDNLNAAQSKWYQHNTHWLLNNVKRK